MKTPVITYLSILCVLLILASQANVVYDNFQLTHDFLKRETNTVLDDAYHAELNTRQKTHKRGSEVRIIPPPTHENRVVYNLDKMNIDKSDVLGLLNTALNDVISKNNPLNLQKLDSITADVLKARNIQSDYVVRVVNPSTG